MDEESSTDIKLALLSSLLPSPPTDSSLLNALVDSNGDVAAAAQILLHLPSSSHSSSTSKKPPSSKRKERAQASLKDWFRPQSQTSKSNCRRSSEPPQKRSKVVIDVDDDDNNESDNPHSSGVLIPRFESGTSPRKPTSLNGKQAVNFMSVLRPPSAKKSFTPQRHPPLYLSSPEMVSQHTPCTLHLSILPPELACDLFYTMLDAAQSWTRNKWWLFDRLVESPHRTSFFARLHDGIDGDETWQEAAQFWSVTFLKVHY